MAKNILYPIIIFSIAALIISGCNKNPVSPPPNNSTDTTSHIFLWNADTLGIYPSELHDVWGTDANNVYAVGLIIYSYNPYAFTAIVHWDGTKWSSMDYHEGYLNGIYGFGPNDIWAVGFWSLGNDAYSLIAHWDGQSWTTWKPQQYNDLFAVWGTSSSNMYAVGAGGLILHYDGSAWSQQQSGSNMLLKDVWGMDSKHIYAAGSQISSGTGVLLESDGNTWKTVTEGGINPDSVTLYGDFNSVWGSSANKLYLVGALAYEGIPNDWSLSNIPYNSEGNNIIGLTAMEKVRGSSSNNVFICGDRDLIIHWNGNSWFIYYQFFDKTKNSSLTGIWIKDKNVFIVGYENGISQAIIYRGSQ